MKRPDDFKNTEINVDHHFYKTWKNKVMLNQFINCACFHMDPEKQDQSAIEIEERNKEIIHIVFEDGYAEELSAENIAHFFGEFGDFQIYKDTRNSAILNFYYIDKTKLKNNKFDDFIKLMKEPENRQKFKIKEITTLDKAQKFKAHNHNE